MADGGEGTVEAAVAAGATRIRVDTVGPVGAPHTASYALHGRTAVVEVASTCGLTLLPEGGLDALGASSRGFGIAVGDAVARCRPSRLVLALGGSASTDGGLGLLEAFGARAYDARGREVPANGTGLLSVAELDLGGLTPPSVEVVVATDVDAPLAGPAGAATVFAPQKGATPAQVEALDAALRRLARLSDHPELADVPGAGAAGGLGFAALLLGGRIVSGASYVLDLLDFDAAVRRADLVITGEGSFDDQTMLGKLPAAVAERAQGRPVHVVAGRDAAADRRAVQRTFASVRSLRAMTDADTRTRPDISRALLRRLAGQIVADHG